MTSIRPYRKKRLCRPYIQLFGTLLALLLASATLFYDAFANSQSECVVNVLKSELPSSFNRFGMGGNYPPESMENFLRAEALAAQDARAQQDLRAFAKYITQTGMNQTRVISEVVGAIPGLQKAMEALPPGSTVVDLGAGYGNAIASAVLGTELGGHHIDVGRETIDRLREKFKHLNFLGITATSAKNMLFPLNGPGGRWHLLTDRLFEDIPDDEIKAYLGGKPAVAYSMFGVFEYTPSPDLAFKKFHNSFPLGSRLFLKTHGNNTSFFQAFSGEFLDYGEYAARCGLKVTRMIHYDHRPKPWLPLESVIDSEFSPGAQAAMSKPGGWGIAGWEIENTATFSEHPVEIVAQWGAKPTTTLFRERDSSGTAADKKKLDDLAIKAGKIPSHIQPKE